MKICRTCKYFAKQKGMHLSICYNSESRYFNKQFSHGKISKACKFYEERLGAYTGLYIDYDEIEGMRFVESLRGRYPSSDFWIIGTGPNLDLYPDDFFHDKLSITLNFACIGFPNSTYFCSFHTKVAEAIVDKLGSEYLDKCIFGAPARKPRDTEFILWWEDWGLDPIYAKSLKKHTTKQNDEDRERMVEQLTDEGLFELVGGNGSVNLAVQVAALLGAKKIILVGCSGKGGDFYYHAQRRGMSEFYREEEWDPSILEMYRASWAKSRIANKQETIVLVRLFKKHGIEIVKHRFDEEKGEFIFEEAEE